ncbi:hypothetical protein Emtol_3985 [Emticicia oligotrophica DSM 17448]|uniref:Capsule assembly protein Wzi n=1 Tax=Emticicia oligotrophica (strain DSM 17448 / CIP 109782 / MTCC 6937 / GPTSA100-15) TaxID=929562 RepID=A0ABN4ATC8_EMTOG|nr:capsule assembly Wzi family protein [Emticicia oligotrophica]AFK05110.1 hypothetical protein Emtol_3985 [Emticicia oligotrophica DSM 17448]
MKKVIIILLFSRLISSAQDSIIKKFNYRFEVGSYFSINNKLPFWQASNQFGSIPTDMPAFLCRQSIKTQKDTLNKFFKFDYGFEAVTILGRSPRLLLPEGFVCTRIGNFEFYAGRRKEIFGIVDTLLSSGSASWSGNSLPLPKVQIGIPNYTKLFFKWLSVKGTFAHGWFGNQTFTKGHYLHQKSLFLRIGNPTSRVFLYGGLVHNVEWGGTPKNILPVGDNRLLNGKFPADWFVYGNVVLPLKSIWRSSSKYQTYNAFETTNHFGNQLGTIDAAAEFKVKRSKVILYRQFLFEDGQLFGLTNTDDGLYGISFTPKPESSFKRVVFEYLFTKNQGRYVAGIGRLLNMPDRHPNEESFLFNHQQYFDGWSYNRRTIGTPFLTPEENIRNENKLGNDNVFVNNNRIWAFYGAFLNQIGAISLSNRLSYSRNFGNTSLLGRVIKPVNQISYSINTIIPLRRLKADLNVNIAIDHGDLIKDNYGTFISIIKKW